MKGKELRIVFMGTPDFAVESLRALVENGYNVVGVITAPDKPSGRGQKLASSAVKLYGLEKGLTILQPDKLKAPNFIEELKSLQADLQVVVAFRMLPEIVWDMPPLGTFNLHGSLLPQYRGAAPLNWAIINGEKETGVTTFKLQHEIDTGNIIDQVKVNIGSDDNVEVLHDKLMYIGAKLVVKTVEKLAKGDVKMISQDELIAKGYTSKHAPKIFKEDCLINWNNGALTLKNRIRGLSPYPTAWTKLISKDGNEKSMKIFSVELELDNHKIEPGTISSDLKTLLKVSVNDGWILIKELQLSGKKRMYVNDFLRGFQQIQDYKAIY